jgi:hypothetical protein
MVQRFHARSAYSSTPLSCFFTVGLSAHVLEPSVTLRCTCSLPLRTSRSTSSPMLHLSSSLYRSVPQLPSPLTLSHAPHKAVDSRAANTSKRSHGIGVRMIDTFNETSWSGQRAPHLTFLPLKAEMMSPSTRRPLWSRRVPCTPASLAGDPSRASSTRMP